MRTLFIVAGAIALAGPATAQPVAATPAQISAMLDRVMQADSNHDGFITRQEWLTYRAAQFDRFDRNHNGYLSEADVPGFLQHSEKGAMLTQAIGDFDADHDGRLSRDEFVHGPTLAFDQIDRDHNGILDPQELKQARERAAAARP